MPTFITITDKPVYATITGNAGDDVFVGKPVASDLVSDELASTGKAIVSEDDSFDFGADETVIPVSEDLVFDPEDIGMSNAELRAVFLEAVAQDVYVHNDEAIDNPDFDFMLDFWG
ncbi:MAG: hypothetical protein L3J65_07085 [Robiginitomaculum sp.]|nr:hypothetical protein [Robiginitomaculum sp.]